MATHEQIKAADKRGKEVLASYPKAVFAKYEPRLGYVTIRFNNGHGLMLNPKKTAGLKRATDSELKSIEITGPGLGLHFPKIDVDLYVPALIDAYFMSKALAASKLGVSGGKVKSKIKAAAARVNGAMGGRPRKMIMDKKKRA